MASEQFFLPSPTAFGSNGLAVPGALANFYATGGLTRAAIYTDAAMTTEHSNPVEANGAGRFPTIYLDDSVTYRLVITDADGGSLGIDDDPYVAPATSAEISTALTTVASSVASTSADAVSTAADVVTTQTARDEALSAAAGGVLNSVWRNKPRAMRWTAPTGMNNPLNIWVDCDGEDYAFNRRPYDLTDWTQDPTITGKTDIYLDYVNGDNANDGLTSGTAWKTWDYAKVNAVDKTIIHLLDERIGYLSNTSGAAAFGTRRIKIIGEAPSGNPTLFSGWRESYDLAHMAWTDNADGSFSSTASVVAVTIKAMGDYKHRDRYGLPLDMPAAASDADARATANSWWTDGTTVTVHHIDGREPDPDDGWIPVASYSNFTFTSDADCTFENVMAAYNSGTGSLAALRFRPATTGAANTIRLAMKNVWAFGCSGNAFELYDVEICALQECYGSAARADIFNYSSFISTGTQAQWMTVYEDNCFGHNAGYTWRENPALSGSNNLSTTHRGMHIWRVNTSGYNIPNGFIADVQAGFSMNFGVRPTQSTAGTLYQYNYWYQALSGEGSTGAKMVLIGCDGDAVDASKYHMSNYNDADSAASLGRIDVADWLGLADVEIRSGTLVYNYETGAALAS